MRPHDRWLDQAWDDLQFGRLGLEAGYLAQTCFLSQQVIEKCLKGYLVFQGRLYPKTHKLADLWRLCEEILQELEPFERQFRVIDEYYIPTRYPDAVPGKGSTSPSIDNAQEALGAAEKVYTLIHSEVGSAGSGERR